jgi:imidazolonepropionase
MTTLFVNIKELLQVRDTLVKKFRTDMAILPTIKNALKDDLIVDHGSNGRSTKTAADKTMDVSKDNIAVLERIAIPILFMPVIESKNL